MTLNKEDYPENLLRDIDEILMLGKVSQDLEFEKLDHGEKQKRKRNDLNNANDKITAFKKNNKDLQKQYQEILKNESEYNIFQDSTNIEKIKMEYEPFLNSHMLEFSNMDRLFDKDVKKTSKYQEEIQKLEQDTEKDKDGFYVKPTESNTAQIIYLKKPHKRETDDLNAEEPKEEKREKLTHTTRISSSTTVRQYKTHVEQYFGLKNNSQLFTQDNQVLNKKTLSLLSSHATNKQLVFTVKELDSIGYTKENVEDEKNNQDAANMTNGSDVIKIHFDEYQPDFDQKYFDLKQAIINKKENEVSENIYDKSSSMTDDHYMYIACVLCLLFIRFFINLVLYEDIAGLGLGFAEIFQQYDPVYNQNSYLANDGMSIYNLNSTTDVREYVNYLTTQAYKDEYYNYGNFEFIGLVGVRAVRTKRRDCNPNQNLTDIEHLCHYESYKVGTKNYDPMYYSYQGQRRYLNYHSAKETGDNKKFAGYYSTIDGSGYLHLLDQENKAELDTINGLFENLIHVLIHENTKAIIINFNVNYVPDNVNFTATIVFEFSSTGVVDVHPVMIELFVMNYMYNRTFQFIFEIQTIVIHAVMLLLYLQLQVDLKRSEFITYCFFSKFGLFNLFYAIFTFLGLSNFIMMQISSGSKISSLQESKDSFYFYEDFSEYISMYETNRVYSAFCLCLILIRVCFMIEATKQGSIIIKSQSLVSRKAVLILMLNFGAIAAFSTIFMYFLGPYSLTFTEFIKTFLVLTIFALQNNLFHNLENFDSFAMMIFFILYIVLIMVVSSFLQVIFTDVVRNIFVLSEDNFTDLATSYTFAEVKEFVSTKICCKKANQGYKKVNQYDDEKKNK